MEHSTALIESYCKLGSKHIENDVSEQEYVLSPQESRDLTTSQYLSCLANTGIISLSVIL